MEHPAPETIYRRDTELLLLNMNMNIYRQVHAMRQCNWTEDTCLNKISKKSCDGTMSLRMNIRMH